MINRLIILVVIIAINASGQNELVINDQGYYEMQGFNVMLFDDFYPEGHQGGLTIIHHGIRSAANGDLRLEPAPGQWSPVPRLGEKIINREKGIITAELWYPDSGKDRKGFNPVIYPDIKLKYMIITEVVGNSIKVSVNLDRPLPDEWVGRVGFNLELFPGHFFGEAFLIDGKPGIFPRQFSGPVKIDGDGNFQAVPLGEGKELIVAPGSDDKEIRFVSNKNELQLIDGRALHNNGWFIIRSIIPAEAGKNAIEWIITPEVNPEWRYKPVIQLSQIGYHPDQNKFSVIELDKMTEKFESVQLIKIDKDGLNVVKEDSNPELWGSFLRFKYLRFDFSNVKEEGLYKIKYGVAESVIFEIKKDIYSRHVWHPTLEYFLPVQMCHMRIEDRYKVWHGLCHMDDALMAPVNHNHFDGYIQVESTLTDFHPGEHVPGLNTGGWHDAGDYDMRIESQAETVYKLSLAYEFFNDDYDETSINQETRLVEIHKPDGKSDILQQIEHGVLTIAGGYESLGRLYRGIIEPTLKQYIHLGDAAAVTDNLIFRQNEKDPFLKKKLPDDDRLVFTEENPQRELYTAQTLAAAYRTLKEFNPGLSVKCLEIAREIYSRTIINEKRYREVRNKINAAGELFLSTSGKEYEEFILKNEDAIKRNILDFSEIIGRVVGKTNNEKFSAGIEAAVNEAFIKISEQQKETPYGVPYKPRIWGAGWEIQSFGVKQMFLHLGFPEIFNHDYAFNALNFVLGCHPGENNASFVSGVGARSLTVAYGVNRDEWSYIPGGVASGTNLIRPDMPELKEWPYIWQQTEYIIGGGAVDFMILAMAADYLFNRE